MVPCHRYCKTHPCSQYLDHRFGSKLPTPTKDFRHPSTLQSNEAFQQQDEGILTCPQVGERNTILGILYLGKKVVPEVAFAGFCLELLKNRDLRLPTKLRVGWKLSFSNLEGRFNLLLWCVHGAKT